VIGGPPAGVVLRDPSSIRVCVQVASVSATSTSDILPGPSYRPPALFRWYRVSAPSPFLTSAAVLVREVTKHLGDSAHPHPNSESAGASKL